MPDLPLTKSAIDLLPIPNAGAVEYGDQKQRALWLRVSSSGTKSWCVRYKFGGKSQREKIGRFPELTLMLARDATTKVLASVASGIDPIAARKVAKEAEAKAKEAEAKKDLQSVAAVGRIYIEKTLTGRHRFNGKPMRLGSHKLERDYFERVLAPRLGDRSLVELTRAEIQHAVDKMEAELSPSAARHSRNVLQKIYAYAMWQDIVTTDPTRFVSAPQWKERERVLTDDELRALWHGLDAVCGMKEVSISPTMAIAIKLAAVTLQRRGEVVGMAIAEIDRKAKTWTMKGERTKNGRTHVVPLSDLALSLIDEAVVLRAGRARESAFVFPSPKHLTKSVAPMAMSHAWGRLLPYLRIPAPTEKQPDRTKPVAGITPHDLRRTGATTITSERIGMPRFVVSQVLNHTSDNGGSAAVTAVYDRNSYMKEKRSALDAWADLLLEIVEVRPRSANVVQFGR